MGKFSGRLLCTDLDGTLLNSDKLVSEKNRRAIEYFKAEGGLFTFCTGRVPSTTKRIYEMINPNCYVGCINGAGVYDFVNQKYIITHTIDNMALTLAEQACEKFCGLGYQVNTFDGIYFCRQNNVMERFRKVTGTPNIEKSAKDISDAMAKIVFGSDDSQVIIELAEFLKSHQLSDRFSFIHSEKTLYEILPKGVSKGTLIVDLAQVLGIDIKDTISVGDYHNDVAMLKTAGISFAVDNACQEAKSVADYITVNNNQDAIYDIIDGLESGRYKRP